MSSHFCFCGAVFDNGHKLGGHISGKHKGSHRGKYYYSISAYHGFDGGHLRTIIVNITKKSGLKLPDIKDTDNYKGFLNGVVEMYGFDIHIGVRRIGDNGLLLAQYFNPPIQIDNGGAVL